ncbi:carbon-nitrogen family hydrolase [Propionivibrio sp.]|uniref:carbon-nitrogen family hydrolase n=1 Tax=Propionivibrio sp. TaxID=2212460 RepID=UPI0039E52099
MKKRISLIQLSSVLAEPDKNYARACALMERALADEPDILVLPETLNTGFFPKERLAELADKDGVRTREIFGAFARTHGVNVVAGSVANLRDGKIFNTAHVFDRQGNLVCVYDKIHGFSPSGEHEFFAAGNEVRNFSLDGIACAMVICYDIRFPEIVRTATLRGVDLFFVPAQWPLARKHHWVTLNTARAIENQMYLCAVNGTGMAGETKYGGNSVLISPWGDEIVHLGSEEEIGCGDIDLDVIAGIRSSINVFRDRQPDRYKL